MLPSRITVFSVALALTLALPALPQSQPDWNKLLERMDRLEHENDSLRQELRALRDELHASVSPDTEERLAVEERRTAEQAQSKVESSQRFPIRLTGMALVNAFTNSRQNGGVDYPTLAYSIPARASLAPAPPCVKPSSDWSITVPRPSKAARSADRCSWISSAPPACRTMS